MSRRRERSTSRRGQIHLCAVCETKNASEMGAKKLTWMCEIPPNSDTYAFLGGRCRTWFCRCCYKDTCTADTIFAERNGHLELEDPAWWTQPRTDAQISYLMGLMDEREVPDELRQTIERPADVATKGDISQWIEVLRCTPWLRIDDEHQILAGSSSTTVH